MLGLRSLRNRLAVVFGLIVLGAIGTIYLTVTPQLEERLQDQKLESLAEDARRSVEGAFSIASDFTTNAPEDPGADDPLQPAVAAAAARSSAEVLVLSRRAEPTSVVGRLDSQPE